MCEKQQKNSIKSILLPQNGSIFGLFRRFLVLFRQNHPLRGIKTQKTCFS